MPRSASKLTKQQERFVELIVAGRSNKAAAIESGYAEAVASETAYDLLSRQKVRKAIDVRMRPILARYAVTADRVMHEMATIAFFDPAEVAETVRTAEDIARLPRHVRAAIAGWTETEHGLQIKFHPKVTALEMLMRKLKLLDGPVVQDNRTFVLVGPPAQATSAETWAKAVEAEVRNEPSTPERKS